MTSLRPILFILTSAMIVAAIWWVAIGQALDQLEKRGQSDLALASDRLVRQLSRYRELIVVTAGDPRLQSESIEPQRVSEILRRAADLSGALDIVLIGPGRKPVASATMAFQQTWLQEPFVERALRGSVGSFHEVSTVFDSRVFYFSAPIFSAEGPVAGALIIVIDVERLEAEGRGGVPAVLFTDSLGVTFFSNRSELVLTQRGQGFRDISARYDPDDLSNFVPVQERQFRDVTLWSIDAGPYVPDRALYVARNLPVIGLEAEALIDARPAYVVAGLQASVPATFFLFIGAILLLTAERRRALARANAALEGRVANRTAELSRINATLRAEIHERKEAELALKRAQDELVQVGKLSALGQMSAGISHELNQPLMAIRSFAENAGQFLERGEEARASRNLHKISDLAGRMARIIKNLKAFARQESEPAAKVDLVAVAEAAIELSETHLERENVSLDFSAPGQPVWVEGGDVRLQQVLVNLITNAADAMAGSANKKIRLQIVSSPEPKIIVQDTGPGIADPKKIFEPFYTTKSVGVEEGTGLGLSISYGLVQSFGGNIVGENAPEGGAIFTVRLKPWLKDSAP